MQTRGVRTAELPLPTGMGRLEPEARDAIASCLSLARERLSMDISWVAEFVDERKVFRVVEGDTDEWGLHDDDWMPIDQSYCRRMLDEQIPNAIRSTAAEPTVAGLEVTRDLRIGSYIGVPLVLPGGELRGAFCCASHTAQHELTERDVRFVEVLAEMVADELAFREALAQVRRLERRVASVDALA
ncbi:MAG TPA: GAF domain-containing protein, partial [Capillimicrobium sp.]